MIIVRWLYKIRVDTRVPRASGPFHQRKLLMSEEVLLLLVQPV